MYPVDVGVSVCEGVGACMSVGANAELFEITKELDESTISFTKKENNWLEIKQGKYLSKICSRT